MISYNFTPSKKYKSKNTVGKFNKKEKQYIKTIVRSFILYIVIAVSSFFIFVITFSNINSLWSLFKPKEHIEEDKFAPAKPYLRANEEFTSKGIVTLEGSSEEGKQIILYKDEQKIADTIVDTENKFKFSDIEINTKEKENADTSFYVIAHDQNGFDSPSSNIVKVTYDKIKPKIEVESPKPDERIKSYSRTLEVTGKAEKDVKVTVNDKRARTNLEGNFSATIALENEVNVIKVVAVDKAGNEEKIEIPVYFEKIED